MGEGSVIFEAVGAALDLVSSMMDDKAKKEKERVQQEKDTQEREKQRIALEMETVRKNQFVGQVFSDIQTEIKANGMIKRTLRQRTDSFCDPWERAGKNHCHSNLYVELKDGVKAVVVADGTKFEAPEFSKISSVSISEEFSRFYHKYPNLPDIKFMSRPVGMFYGSEKKPEAEYKRELLSYVQRQRLDSEVNLSNLTLCHDDGLLGSKEDYITANLLNIQEWITQTQHNLLHIVDLFNRYLQGEDLSSVVPAAGGNVILGSRRIGGFKPMSSPFSGSVERPAVKTPAVKKGAILGLVENATTEFKTSIIFSPENNQPSSDQLIKIAREIAGFMNTDGGDLYLGVDDSGCVVGIQSDLYHLKDAVICGQNERSDQDYTYHPNRDGFAQKLQNLVRFCLGEIAAKLLDDPEFIHDDVADVDYVKLHIYPSNEKLVYCGKYEDVYIRSGTSVVRLKGAEREDYVSRRFRIK